MTRRLPISVCAALLLVLAALPAGPATANVKTVEDRRDAKGDSVDIESASADHRGNKLIHTIDAYGAFSTKKAPCLWMRLEPTGEGYEVCGNGKLTPSVVGMRPAGTSATVERPAEDQIVYVIPLRKIGNPDTYSWNAFVGCACDFAPNNGLVKHSL